MECAIVHAVVSSARAVVSTAHAMDSRMGRGTEGFVLGMLDVGLGGLCKEIAQKVAKTAKKVKEKKGPSLAHHAVGQRDKPKSEGEGQLWALVSFWSKRRSGAQISWIGYLPDRG